MSESSIPRGSTPPDQSSRGHTCELLFDETVAYGSAEHYFHFLWGYLLPAIHAIHEAPDGLAPRYRFRSCGPVMDVLTQEIASLFRYEAEIVPKAAFRQESEGRRIDVPRWDIGLLRDYLFGPDAAGNDRASLLQKRLREHRPLRERLEQPGYMADLAGAIVRVRSLFFRELDRVAEPPGSDEYAGCYLLLARSPRPDFYARDGQAEHRGYGMSRRALLELDEAEESLRKSNIPARVYEPGRQTLVEQIRVFRRCKGIVGVKGAEFANLVWLPPACRVIMLKPVSMETPPVQRCLAELLGHHYTEVVVEARRTIRFNPDWVREYLV